MPEIARRPSYEEDVEWAIAVLALPELAENKKLFGAGKEATLKLAREHCCNYYPDIFEQLTGQKATSKNSWKRAETEFYRDHANDWIVIAAYGDWKEGVPKGFVLGEATLGGKRKNAALRSFLIPKQRYDKRRSVRIRRSSKEYIVVPALSELAENNRLCPGTTS